MYETVLVTGAGGFIGSHVIARQLELGRRVRALDIHLSRLDHISDPSLERMEGDFTDAEVQQKAVEGIDAVFHLASAHLEVNVPEDTYWRVNVRSLPEFLKSCRDAGVRRFVHVSSVGVYGDVKEERANEDSPCNPVLLYERTKFHGEQEVKKFLEDTGFEITIVRPSWVYGPGCPRTDKLFQSVRKKRFFFVGSGKTLRHCIYIDDFVNALELASTQDAAIGRTYVIGDHAPVTLNTLIGEIARVSGVSSPRLHIPVWLMGIAGFAMEAAFIPFRKEPPFSRRTIRFFTGNTAFDTSRAQTELGFEPRYDIESGMEAYSQWVKNGQPPVGISVRV